MDKMLFSAKDAARLLKISDRRVRQLVTSGMLKARKVGGGYVVEEDALADLIRTWKPLRKGGK